MQSIVCRLVDPLRRRRTRIPAAFNKAHAFSLLVHYFNGTVTRMTGENVSINAILKRARIMFHRKMLK